MNTTRYHTFDVGKRCRGAINMANGDLDFIHEDIAHISNIMPIGVYHQYNSDMAVNNTNSTYGRGFEIKLSPDYDESNNFYQNRASVIKNGSLFTKIRDIHGNEILFIYTNNKLSAIIDTHGNQTSFNYSSNLLTEIVYSNGTKTIFGYTNNLLNKVITPSRTGVEITYESKKVKAIKNTIYLNSVGQGVISPVEHVDLNTLAVSESKKISFFYDDYIISTTTNGNTTTTITGPKNTKKDVESGTDITYWFGVDGLTKEELVQKGSVEQIVTYTRTTYQDGDKQESIYYNRDKDDEKFLVTTYDKEGKITNEHSGSYYNVVSEGKVVEKLFKRVNRFLYYTNKNLMQDVTTVTYAASKTSTERISEKLYNAYYQYNSKNMPIKITYLNGTVQEIFYDQNDNATKLISYNVLNSNKKTYVEYEINAYGQVVGEIDECGKRTIINYINGTNIVSSVIDPYSNEIFLITNPQTFDIDSIYMDDGNGINKIEFGYTNEFLTRLSDGTTQFDFEYYSKDLSPVSQFKSKQNIKINNVVLLTNTYNVEDSIETSLSSYINGEKIKTVKDDSGNVNVYYDSKSGIQQKLITEYYNEKTHLLEYFIDHLTKDSQKYSYDINGNTIAIENKEQKTTISVDNQEKLTDTKIILKGIGIAHDYSYSYNESDQIETIHLPDGKIETVSYDGLGRIKEIAGPSGSNNILYKEGTLNQTGNYTTHFIEKINQGDVSTNYNYDDRGNIIEVYSNNQLVLKYEYDSFNRLTKETNVELGTIYSFEYNIHGNMVTKSTCPLNNLTNVTEKLYSYDGNKLLSFNGQLCNYDSLGNPEIYLNKLVEWSHIRQMDSFDGVKFEYNAEGTRIKKICNGHITKFYNTGDILIAEKRTLQKNNDTFSYCNLNDNGFVENNYCYAGINSNENNYSYAKIIQYLYGANGITGFVINGSSYYYQKNIQGDITHIIDSDNNVVAEYVYNAWGYHEIVTDINGIGSINPIRYRGSYYDDETKLYWVFSVNSYYDPETGRYINPDILPTGDDGCEIDDLNLYLYSNNNPINYIVDYSDKSFNYIMLNIIKYKKPPNPNQRHGANDRKPKGLRERNIGHPNGEEHGRRAKGNKGIRKFVRHVPNINTLLQPIQLLSQDMPWVPTTQPNNYTVVDVYSPKRPEYNDFRFPAYKVPKISTNATVVTTVGIGLLILIIVGIIVLAPFGI